MSVSPTSPSSPRELPAVKSIARPQDEAERQPSLKSRAESVFADKIEKPSLEKPIALVNVEVIPENKENNEELTVEEYIAAVTEELNREFEENKKLVERLKPLAEENKKLVDKVKLLEGKKARLENKEVLLDEEITRLEKENALLEDEIRETLAADVAALTKRVDNLSKEAAIGGEELSSAVGCIAQLGDAWLKERDNASHMHSFLQNLLETSRTFDGYKKDVNRIKKNQEPIGKDTEEKLTICTTNINDFIQRVRSVEEKSDKDRPHLKEALYLSEKGAALIKKINRVRYKYFIQTFEKIIADMRNSQLNQAKEKLLFLPSAIQGAFFEKHWIECGRPTPKSSEESQRNRAHADFGKVSFLDSDPRKKCVASPEEKMRSLNAHLAGLNETLENYSEKTT